MPRHKKNSFLLLQRVSRELASLAEISAFSPRQHFSPRRQGGASSRIILAVSGGRDSVVMLDASAKLQKELGLSLTVAHVDHGLRPESAADAEFVRQLADKYGLPFELCPLTPPHPRRNLEAWAREQRYRALEAVREKVQAHWVCTAHHRGDQAETILMRLLSGRLLTSARGICAQDPRRHLSRPMLVIKPELIQAYLEEQALEFRRDSMNEDPQFTRTRLRHRLIPQITAEFQSNIVDLLAEFGQRLGEDEAYLAQQCEERIFQHLSREGNPLNVEFLRELPPALRWRALKVLAQRQFGEEGGKIGYHALKRLQAAVMEPTGEALEIELRERMRGKVVGQGSSRVIVFVSESKG